MVDIPTEIRKVASPSVVDVQATPDIAPLRLGVADRVDPWMLGMLCGFHVHIIQNIDMKSMVCIFEFRIDASDPDVGIAGRGPLDEFAFGATG